MDTDIFDASKLIAQKPWLDRALENIAPTWALKRLEARVAKSLFEYNAARTNRLYAPKQYAQPAESSQNQRDRVVMMYEAQDLVQNFPEAREISRKFGTYLTPNEYSPTTGDRDYNQTISEYFHAWCKTCDVTNRHSFKKLVQLAAEERPVDGDCGFVIRRSGEGLKLQLVPATRIGNPNDTAVASNNYFQGIITNDFGQPVAYRIYRVSRDGVYFGAEDIPANQFCHYLDPFRVDQYRGITDFHAAIQTARMLHDILQAEKAGVRFSSQQAALIFNDRGVANPRNLFQPNPALSLPNGQQQKNELTEVGMIRYFQNSDRVEVMPSRPSQAFTGFVQHLMHEIALGVGVPEGVLFGTQDYKGPSVRAEFAAADRVFTRQQGVLTDKVLDPIKDAVILDAIARGEIPPPPLLAGETMVHALRRATSGEWRFPAKLSIDVGRESAANMNENRQGAKSLQEIAAEEGTDAFTRLEQIAIEAAYVKQLAEKYGVPETAIRLTTNSLPSTPAAAAAASDAVGVSAAEAQAASVTATATGGESTDVAAIAGVESFPDVSTELAPLNGAQIAAVLSILENLRAGDLTSEAAETLMVSAGMAKESASKVASSVAGLPKQPSKVSASSMHHRIRLARAHEDSNLVTINFADGSYIPTNAMANNARRALAIREKKPMSQRGMTSVGIARARDIMNKRPMSEDTVRRMKAFFDRHEIDKQGATWKDEGKGFQAWYGWGGDAGYSWATAIVERLNKPQANSAKNESRTEFSAATEVAMVLHEKPENPNDWLTAVEQYRKQLDIRCGEAAKPIVAKSIIGLAKEEACPIETQDIKTNLTNRAKAVDVANYGPANPLEPNADYWKAKADQFKTTPEEAKTMRCGNCAAFNITKRIEGCITKGIGADAGEVEAAGKLGLCEFFDFKCAALRTCDAWVVGGPITDESAKLATTTLKKK
jgi:capsid protein